MTVRFIIDCYGIIDTWNTSSGTCKDRMSWAELCETLNELNDIADNKLDNYEYVTRLEKENKILKEKIIGISGLNFKLKEYLNDIDSIIDY